MEQTDALYLDIILDPIRTCANYKPKFGRGSKGGGLTLEQFQELYQKDPFYKWFGLDHPLMYAAHKVAGGMTSVYRQIGVGCEKLFKAILCNSLGLSDENVTWSYEITLSTGKKRTLYLDARVTLEQIPDKVKREKFRKWMEGIAKNVGIDYGVFTKLKGTVFEVRQGYKSKDSKRQNADIANAAIAYTNAYLPCAVILSTQIDVDVLDRYRREKWAILIGTVNSNNPLISTYDFMRDIVGYDLAKFFARNSEILSKVVVDVLKALLNQEGER